jgi:hypothetical protein
MTQNKTIIGRLESIELPEFGIKNLQARVDTGAETSSLHVDNIEKLIINGLQCVSFDIHPDSHNVKRIGKCHAPISDIRKIKSSNGTSELRYVIVTSVVLGKDKWSIEITLTDRSDMSYLMLFGREAIGTRFLIDPSQVFLGSKSNLVD